MTTPRVAIVHDWLTNMGGAESLVLELHKLYPEAPIYTSVYDKAALPAFHDLDVRTTYLQTKLPRTLRFKHALWPTERAKAFRQLDLSEYDVIISSSSAEAKAVRKSRPGQVHIAYIHTPIRYYWSHYEEFRKEFNFGTLTPFIRPMIPRLVKRMRVLDLASTEDIDVFIANSTITQERIKQYYGKPSTVVHPPVDIARFKPASKAERRGYILWGRHVPYKRFDLAIAACNQIGADLTVVGSGSDTDRLKKLAGPTIHFTGRISDADLVARAQSATAFLFPNEEDFGISAVEALAAGTPVVAYAKGGVLDIVQDASSGVLFDHQTTDGLVAALKRFETLTFNPALLQQKAKRFAPGLFDTKIRKIVDDSIAARRQT